MIERPRAWRGFCWVSGLIWRGVGLHKRRGFRATRLTVEASNDLQTKRNLTGGLPMIYRGHSANLSPFREHFYPAHETRSERCDGRVRVWLGSEWTTERTGGTRMDGSFEKHADEMQMMTWQNATRKQMTWQQRQVAEDTWHI